MSKLLGGDKLDEPQAQEIKLTRNVDVDVVYGTNNIRFVCSFSFEINQGRNNFEKITTLVDEQINDTRQEVLRKIASKLGVKVDFVS